MKTPVLEIKESPGKGMGVFATTFIPSGSIIETTYLIKVDTKPSELGHLYDYVFNYPHSGPFKHLVLPLGAGCIYNHDDNNNAIWQDSKIPMHFDYVAIKDIQPGEEICTHYGDMYWEQMA